MDPQFVPALDPESARLGARPNPNVAAVVIGRNEGARLIASLTALKGQVARIIYVDSGSSDGSPAAASALGAQVVDLDLGQPFTAARARNAGLAALAQTPPKYVMLLDGDCILDPGFIPEALMAFKAHPEAAVICGRRRERHPEASIYNRMIDAEWDTPIGEALASGGDALMDYAALQNIGGYRATLIAGEEPELCQRLRRQGRTIWRIDAEMSLHDAAMTRFSQWWQRSRRAGYAFAEGAALHGAGPDRHWRRETRRALFWGLFFPLISLALSLLHPAALALLLLYPLQLLRLGWRARGQGAFGWQAAVFTLLGKVPEALGACAYWRNRIRGKTGPLIEYK